MDGVLSHLRSLCQTWVRIVTRRLDSMSQVRIGMVNHQASARVTPIFSSPFVTLSLSLKLDPLLIVDASLKVSVDAFVGDGTRYPKETKST